jgi:hypothetical protein
VAVMGGLDVDMEACGGKEAPRGLEGSERHQSLSPIIAQPSANISVLSHWGEGGGHPGPLLSVEAI